MTTTTQGHVTFVPGAHWTPERIERALAEVRAAAASPEMMALMDAIAQATDGDHDPASTAAALSSVSGAAELAGPVDRAKCVFRRGSTADTAPLQRLITSGHLPPFFVEQFVEGFLVVEHEGSIVGCGGNEHYGDSAVIRSVVVHESARGLGLGMEIANLLVEDAVASGAEHLYLFTLEAYEFWKRIGFIDLDLEKWSEAAREQWQYRFITDYPDAVADVRRMWMPASAAASTQPPA